MQRSIKIVSIALIAAASATGCIDEAINDNGPGALGGTGNLAAGGESPSSTTQSSDLGGAPAGTVGGATNSPDTGGVWTLGGAATTGGVQAFGGAAPSGGSSIGVATTSAGGAIALGGASSSGGRMGRGGATSKGSGSQLGGATSKGGASSVGGASSAGGATATGGGTASSTCPEGNTQLCGMVDAHNAARAAVVPVPTTPLPAMTWDATVAAAAQSWAESCKFEHFIATGSNQGQNLYASTGSGTPKAPASQSVVSNWVGEVDYYNYDANTCQSGQMCGHYTQVVWRKSTLLGCGIKYCTVNSPFSSSTNWWIVVCNYSPAGNYVGQKPY